MPGPRFRYCPSKDRFDEAPNEPLLLNWSWPSEPAVDAGQVLRQVLLVRHIQVELSPLAEMRGRVDVETLEEVTVPPVVMSVLIVVTADTVAVLRMNAAKRVVNNFFMSDFTMAAVNRR